MIIFNIYFLFSILQSKLPHPKSIYTHEIIWEEIIIMVIVVFTLIAFLIYRKNKK